MPDQNATAQTGGRIDPFRAYNFKLEIQGVTEGHFTECSGLGVRVKSIAYREGGASQVVRRLPGPVEYADVTLRYGLTDSTDLWEWFLSAVQGTVERRNISIVLMDSDGTAEATRWNLIDAWPTEWRGAVLNALSHEAAIESLTIVFESMERV